MSAIVRGRGPLSDRVAFLGLSHLGIVSSAAWAARGLSVVAIDPDADLVSALSHGEPPVHELGLPELIASARERLRYSARLDEVAGCAMVVVSRDVPTDDDGRSDVGVITDLIGAAIPHLAQDVTIVLMSQVAPGYTRALGDRLVRQRPDLRFRLHYVVETLVLGDAVRRATRPERFIVGAADAREPIAPALREALERFGCPILEMSYESAELAKTAINLYLIGSVTYANTMADLCEAVGADWSQIVPALRLDARIGPAAYLRPGLGIAGGNLERDLETLRAIGRTHDVDLTLLTALAAHNERRFEWVLRRLDDVLATSSGRKPTIAIWGLAYKKGTRSLKNAASLRLIERMRGRAAVRAWDPIVTKDDLERVLGHDHAVGLASSPEETVVGADCLVILTDSDEIRALDPASVRRRMRRPVIIDCVGIIDASRALRDDPDLRFMGRS